MKKYFSKYFCLATALLVICSCGKNEPQSVQEAAALAKCEIVSLSSSENIFNSQSAKCLDESRVYWFPTPEANKSHAEMCVSFGGKKVTGGKNWTQYKPSC